MAEEQKTHTHVLEDGTVVEHSHGEHGHHHSHAHTKAVLNRMSRAIGHMESIKRMIEDGRDCAEVLIQLSAVKSAINNTGKIILQDHIEHCIVDAVEHGDGQLVVGLDEAEIVAAVERRAALGEDGVAGDLALVLQLIIIKVERELERTGGGEHGRLVPVVFLAGDGIVIGDSEVRLVEVIFRAERVEAGGKRIRFIGGQRGRGEQKHG